VTGVLLGTVFGPIHKASDLVTTLYGITVLILLATLI
jgi:hypothetical protein